MLFFSTPIFGQDLRCRVPNIIKWLIFTLIATLGVSLLVYNLYVSGIPNFINDLIYSLPDEMRVFLYIDKIPDFSNSTFDYAICMQVLFLIGCAYACYLGNSAFQVSRNNGIVKYIHSLPVSRTCVVITRFIAQLAILVVYNLLLIFLSIWIAIRLDVNNFIFNLPNVLCTMLMGQLLFLAIGFSISCIVKYQSTPYTFAFLSLLFCLIMHVLDGIFSKKIFSMLVLVSHYSPYNIIMTNDSISILSIFVSILFCLVSIAISATIYRYKEL